MGKKSESEFRTITIIIFGAIIVLSFVYAIILFLPVVYMFGAAIVGASTTFFLHDACFPPGKIFASWIPFVETKFRDNLKNPFRFLANPLGLCAYCQNIWISLGVYIVMALKLSGVTFWLLLPSLTLSHIFLNILDKSFWRQ